MSFQQLGFQQNAFQVEVPGAPNPRTPLVMLTPRAAQIGFADVLPNLLLTTLSAVALPFVQQLSTPAPQPKAQVRCEQQLNLIKHPLPDFIPVGRQVSDSAPIRKYALVVPLIPGQIPQPAGAVALPVGVVQDASAPARKYAVAFEHPPNLLGKLLPGPQPIGDQISDSAPPPKFRVTGPLLVGQIPQPSGVAPAPLPIGSQISNSAPPPKYRPQVDVYPDNLTLGIPPPAQVPAWADFDQVPAPSRFLPPFDPPNLLTSTLFSAQPLPAGRQLSDSAPPPKYRPQVDIVRTDLARGIPVVPPPAIPLGLPVDTSQFMPKFVVQVDVYPNTTLIGIPPPAPVPVSGVGSNPGGGAGGRAWSGKFEFSRKPIARPPLTEAEYEQLPESRQSAKPPEIIQASLEQIVGILEAENRPPDDDDDEAILLLLQ